MAQITNEKLKHFIREKGIYAAMIITVCGLIGIPILFLLVSSTVIGIGTILIMFFGCGMLGIIQWKYVKDDIDMAYNQFAMYAFAGFGMCLVNLILFINFSIPIKSHTETYTISRAGSYNEIVIADKDENGSIERVLNSYISDHPNDASSSANEITISFKTGLFGLDIISNCTFK